MTHPTKNDKKIALSDAMAWAVVVSALSHIFCCGIPFVVALLNIAGGLGFLSVIMPASLKFHALLEAWEIPMLLFSALMLIGGWILHIQSTKIKGCKAHLCCHHDEDHKKNFNHWIMIAATILFAVNILVLVFSDF
jgi:hypothetical protein